mmetsp:Transcript_3835/g.8350  ORF Transcript_3835/g.8350 Transcript_3835/m.8350 type:complete len:104 (+) Transcript_3835:85-396(+)|eukprot:CAMPEP_0178400606 /NCGR_PEP_ID=MMETSP0689_2-20121128/15876_1 /TAXON_ID=160604 /ORGANISM="Amphidinium massartii, Strain CS-259" /LENGTH=103 /DNA_ID=CAMNT_0020021407 /DNA_START=83 /DNA_END=394 /DNA_ORIENTATION=+
MARNNGSILAAAFVVAILFVSLPSPSSFVGFRSGPASQTTAPVRGAADMGRTMGSRVSMAAQPGGAPPNRINLAFLGFIAGMAVLGLLAAFFYGSYVGLGSSL